MLHWYPAGNGSCLTDRIVVLPDDVRFVPGVSPETERDQQVVQVGQRGRRNTGCLDLHPGTGDGIQHPCREDGDHARHGLDMHYVAIGSSLFILRADTAAMQRVPTIVDNDFLPDMGRMTPQWC
jgi:hypothetical protein